MIFWKKCGIFQTRNLKWIIFIHIVILVVTARFLNTKKRIADEEFHVSSRRVKDGYLTFRLSFYSGDEHSNITTGFSTDVQSKDLGQMPEINTVKNAQRLEYTQTQRNQIQNTAQSTYESEHFTSSSKQGFDRNNTTTAVKPNLSQSDVLPLKIVVAKNPTQVFLETYSSLCNKNTPHRKERKTLNNNNNTLPFCSCLPATLRE